MIFISLSCELCSESTFIDVKLWGWGGDGYSVHGDGWECSSASVPVQTSTVLLTHSNTAIYRAEKAYITCKLYSNFYYI